MSTKTRSLLASVLLVLPALLKADIESEVFSRESINPPTRQKPFSVSLEADLVQKTKVKDTKFERQYFTFRYSELEADMVFYHNPCYHEAALITIGYNFADLPWENNPFFQQSHFETISVAATVNTQRIRDWEWTAQAELNIDANHFDFEHYAYYDLLAWGRYSYSDDIGVHVGIFVETGMNITWVWPIFGFDWQVSDDWKLNLVFPMNISAVYTLNQVWSLAFETRFFDVRYRVNKHEPLSEGLLIYQNLGGEVAMLYHYNDTIEANLHVGATMGGRLKVANRHYQHRRHFDLDPSGYFGGEISYMF